MKSVQVNNLKKIGRLFLVPIFPTHFTNAEVDENAALRLSSDKSVAPNNEIATLTTVVDNVKKRYQWLVCLFSNCPLWANFNLA